MCSFTTSLTCNDNSHVKCFLKVCKFHTAILWDISRYLRLPICPWTTRKVTLGPTTCLSRDNFGDNSKLLVSRSWDTPRIVNSFEVNLFACLSSSFTFRKTEDAVETVQTDPAPHLKAIMERKRGLGRKKLPREHGHYLMIIHLFIMVSQNQPCTSRGVLYLMDLNSM
jgi:hypothetical protein